MFAVVLAVLTHGDSLPSSLMIEVEAAVRRLYLIAYFLPLPAAVPLKTVVFCAGVRLFRLVMG